MAGSCRLRRLNRDLGTSATDGWWATLDSNECLLHVKRFF
jgi:hypothetical protein